MSWSRGTSTDWMRGSISTVTRGGFLADSRTSVVSLTPAGAQTFAGITTAPPPEPSRTLDDLRQRARATYLRGGLLEAIDLQQHILLAAKAAGELLTDDLLFLGLMLHGAQRPQDGVAILREGTQLFPENASMQENLGVLLLAVHDVAGAIGACQQALALGSDSPNVNDCLCDAYNRIGRTDLAVASGKAALEAKDRRFAGKPLLAKVPNSLPPPFNFQNPAENVIAFCLWGNEPRYHVPLLENVRILPHLFPGWSIRVYHDASVSAEYLADLHKRGVQLRPMTLQAGLPPHRRLLWRFDVVADPSVKRFLIRDADSLLSVKERVAVDAWLQSRFHFHAMRDWFTHTDLLLAGMWGGVGNILPPTETLVSAYTAWRVENDHVDQDVLAETVWPTIRRDVLIHDSIFTGCLGSVAFPPFGVAPPGYHVGQNAFLHFKRDP